MSKFKINRSSSEALQQTLARSQSRQRPEQRERPAAGFWINSPSAGGSGVSAPVCFLLSLIAPVKIQYIILELVSGSGGAVRLYTSGANQGSKLRALGPSRNLVEYANGAAASYLVADLRKPVRLDPNKSNYFLAVYGGSSLSVTGVSDPAFIPVSDSGFAGLPDNFVFSPVSAANTSEYPMVCMVNESVFNLIPKVK